MFCLGTHQPQWLWKPSIKVPADVTWFISDRRLDGRITFGRALNDWWKDSGGFTMIKDFGGYTFTARQYADRTRRHKNEIGRLGKASIMDWMCEVIMLKKTGKTILQHQALTIDSYIELNSIAPDLPWMPVLQGFTKEDYLDHLDEYARRGVDLTKETVVGVGSVCRRQGTKEFVSIVRALVACGLSLHGFGVKTLGLEQVASLLYSSDSMAWSIEARWLQRPGLPQCVGSKHKNCANCLPYALDWRERLLAKLPASWRSPTPAKEIKNALSAVA